MEQPAGRPAGAAAPPLPQVLAAGGLVAGGVDPLDLAVQRGEAAFETLRVYAGRPFRAAAHLRRLAASAAALDLPLPDGLAALVERAAAAAGGGDAVLRLFCTKGTETARTPAAFAVVSEPPAAYAAQRRRGIAVVLLTLACDPLLRAASPWLLPAVKSTSYAVAMAAQRAAQRRGADDAVFVGLGGELLEAPTANLWWRAGRRLFTPALDLGILPGITRAALLELAPGLGLDAVEGVFGAEDLAGADEAFLSSSTREVMPVVAVDDAPIGDGRPGPAAADLQAALRRLAAS
jgi:4-amino-4-deoxychorismate lyase